MWKLCRWCGIKLKKGSRGKEFCCNAHYQEYRRKMADKREEELAEAILRSKPMQAQQAKINAYLTGKLDIDVDELVKDIFGRSVEE